MKSLLKRLMGIRDEPDRTTIQEVFENMTIVEGQYTEQGRNYVEVEEVARYLEDRP